MKRSSSATSLGTGHRQRRRRKLSFQDVLPQFVTPQVFKQGHQAWQTSHAQCSWSLKAILSVSWLMTWAKGDAQAERFLDARAYFVSRHPHEKRPGQTWEGFQQALRRLPMAVFGAVAAALREQLGKRWLDELRIGGWLPVGCDGSRLECPRSAQLEKCLGQAGKDESAPMMYLSALVLLPLGLLWSWRLDKGTGSEHQHLRQLLPTLPERSLLVGDAAYIGYDLYRSILQAGHAFLMRMSSRAYLWTETEVPLQRFREGWVYYWPQEAQDKKLPPIRARLLRVPGKKGDVWLLTNLDRATLSRRQAGQMYRWRWRNEGLFRTYKRTLDKIKLQHRTVAMAFREAEGSLLALQLLLAMGVQAMEQEGCSRTSPRQIVLHIRGAMVTGIAGLGPRQRQRYTAMLEDIHHHESPTRTSSKTRRPWPRRKEHKPPKPPHLLRLTTRQKHRLRILLRAA